MTQTDRTTGLVGNAAFKVPVRAATTANITLSGEQTIDNVACVDGNRVLVKNQTDQTDNGIYVVDTGAWDRAKDFDGVHDVVNGTLVMVIAGTTNINTYWRCTTADTVDIDTDNITFEQALLSDTALASFLQAGTGAVARNAQDKMRDAVSVMDFDATGDGVANDWEYCQKATDYIQALGGGVVFFTPGKTYRIAGNTLIIWGDNVSLMGYGATIYKDNAGGSAGTYGDAITVFGKLNGNLYWSPQVAGGTYSVPALYSGSTIPSQNVNIEGFKVTFGAHSSDTINGISGLNLEHVTVKNCVVEGAPQTSFAWIATDSAHCTHLTMENCLSDGAGMQGYRFNSYTPNAGELTAHVVNCRSENTQLTVAVPWPEQYGLPSSAFVRASGTNLQHQVTFEACQFDGAVHLLDGYRTTSFKNCRLGFVFALNASAGCALLFENCRFREFDTATGFGTIATQIYARNTYNGPASLIIDGCSWEAAGATQYNIYSRGFDLDVRNVVNSDINIYSIEWSTYLSATNLERCSLFNPGTSPLTLAGRAASLKQCDIYSPIDIIQATRKTITLQDNKIHVDATFATNCVTITGGAAGDVIAEGNIIDYENNAYATITLAPIANIKHKKNAYLYDGGTTFSYDETYGTGAPANGYWQVSSRVINSAPTAGQPKAWVCTVAGAPGTWVSEGNL